MLGFEGDKVANADGQTFSNIKAALKASIVAENFMMPTAAGPIIASAAVKNDKLTGDGGNNTELARMTLPLYHIATRTMVNHSNSLENGCIAA